MADDETANLLGLARKGRGGAATGGLTGLPGLAGLAAEVEDALDKVDPEEQEKIEEEFKKLKKRKKRKKEEEADTDKEKEDCWCFKCLMEYLFSNKWIFVVVMFVLTAITCLAAMVIVHNNGSCRGTSSPKFLGKKFLFMGKDSDILHRRIEDLTAKDFDSNFWEEDADKSGILESLYGMSDLGYGGSRHHESDDPVEANGDIAGVDFDMSSFNGEDNGGRLQNFYRKLMNTDARIRKLKMNSEKPETERRQSIRYGRLKRSIEEPNNKRNDDTYSKEHMYMTNNRNERFENDTNAESVVFEKNELVLQLVKKVEKVKNEMPKNEMVKKEKIKPEIENNEKVEPEKLKSSNVVTGKHGHTVPTDDEDKQSQAFDKMLDKVINKKIEPFGMSDVKIENHLPNDKPDSQGVRTTTEYPKRQGNSKQTHIDDQTQNVEENFRDDFQVLDTDVGTTTPKIADFGQFLGNNFLTTSRYGFLLNISPLTKQTQDDHQTTDTMILGRRLLQAKSKDEEELFQEDKEVFSDDVAPDKAYKQTDQMNLEEVNLRNPYNSEVLKGYHQRLPIPNLRPHRLDEPVRYNGMQPKPSTLDEDKLGPESIVKRDSVKLHPEKKRNVAKVRAKKNQKSKENAQAIENKKYRAREKSYVSRNNFERLSDTENLERDRENDLFIRDSYDNNKESFKNIDDVQRKSPNIDEYKAGKDINNFKADILNPVNEINENEQYEVTAKGVDAYYNKSPENREVYDSKLDDLVYVKDYFTYNDPAQAYSDYGVLESKKQQIENEKHQTMDDNINNKIKVTLTQKRLVRDEINKGSEESNLDVNSAMMDLKTEEKSTKANSVAEFFKEINRHIQISKDPVEDEPIYKSLMTTAKNRSGEEKDEDEKPNLKKDSTKNNRRDNTFKSAVNKPTPYKIHYENRKNKNVNQIESFHSIGVIKRSLKSYDDDEYSRNDEEDEDMMVRTAPTNGEDEIQNLNDTQIQELFMKNFQLTTAPMITQTTDARPLTKKVRKTRKLRRSTHTENSKTAHTDDKPKESEVSTNISENKERENIVTTSKNDDIILKYLIKEQTSTSEDRNRGKRSVLNPPDNSNVTNVEIINNNITVADVTVKTDNDRGFGAYEFIQKLSNWFSTLAGFPPDEKDSNLDSTSHLLKMITKFSEQSANTTETNVTEENDGHKTRRLLSIETEKKDGESSRQKKTANATANFTQNEDKSNNLNSGADNNNNKTVVKRSIEDEGRFWNNMYDEDYGVKEPVENTLDWNSLLSRDTVKRSGAWLHKKMRAFSDSFRKSKDNIDLDDNKYDYPNDVYEDLNHRVLKRDGESYDYDNIGGISDVKKQFQMLTKNMKQICQEAAKAARTSKNMDGKIGRQDDRETTMTTNLMQQLVRLMSDLVDYEVQKKTCRRLPPDLSEFLSWLTAPDPNAAIHKDKSSATLDMLAVSQSEKEDPHADSRSDCLGTISAVQELMVLYDEMTDDEKSKMSGVKEYLENQLTFLNKKLINREDNSFLNSKNYAPSPLSRRGLYSNRRIQPTSGPKHTNNQVQFRPRRKYFNKYDNKRTKATSSNFDEQEITTKVERVENKVEKKKTNVHVKKNSGPDIDTNRHTNTAETVERNSNRNEFEESKDDLDSGEIYSQRDKRSYEKVDSETDCKQNIDLNNVPLMGTDSSNLEQQKQRKKRNVENDWRYDRNMKTNDQRDTKTSKYDRYPRNIKDVYYKAVEDAKTYSTMKAY